jgi:hypothetical protein
VTKADYYRQKAAGAKTMAGAVDDVVAKALWLELAENWLRMIPGAERSGAQHFDTAVLAQATNEAPPAEQ